MLSDAFQTAVQRLKEENARLRLSAERDGYARDADELRAAVHRLTAENETGHRTADYWKAEHLAGNAEIERLTEERDALRKDAERYRWLRSLTRSERQPFVTLPFDAVMDKAIDAAMAAQPGGER